ncbi:MAG: site-specific DNA-methyltransferase [bacterium]|nr:site-specific DNA-methyltransferase [bacterium]
MARKKGNSSIPITSVKHKDKRKNIPTEELRNFVVEDELQPKTIKFPGLLYARDPSLDPQLVWKGKDEQDREPLEVPAVPIYIQEKIQPQVIIEEVRAQAKEAHPEPQADLFADFNGIKFDELVDFYRHDQNWANRMILGDSLLVMTSLAEKEGLKGKVQFIYLDPPYGINFGSNWQVSTRKRDVKDGKAEDATRQPEQIRAFRDTWKLGIHSYLAYLRDRLIVARELLTESGSVFVQIGDENVHLVRCLMDEVFGSENFVSLIFLKKSGTTPSNQIANVGDYLIWYAKSKENVKYRQIYWEKNLDVYTQKDENGDAFNYADLQSGGEVKTEQKFIFQGSEYYPRSGYHWSTTIIGLEKLSNTGRIELIGNNLRYKRFAKDFPATEITNMWDDLAGIAGTIYVVQTPNRVIERCLLMTTDPGDLVLDPTCGSGTTAYVAEQWGRRWITIDTSRVALALARTRLMVGKYPYYLLSDSREGVHKEAELTGKIPPDYKTEGDIKKGFVYKRVPHITLKSIANNPDIKEGMTRAEIDAAIAKHADTELLYDQPYENNKRIRVSGPFTVESLSPHRTISVEKKIRKAEGKDEQFPGLSIRVLGAGQFEHIIIEYLKKSGIQNTVKQERLKFDTLDPFAGEWLQAAGTYFEGNKSKRLAVCIGPEYGTVGSELVKEAAKEAVKGVGFDIVAVCGFAFDPSVNEEAKRYGKLTVLIVRMNPDLSMGDELLKKTGAGNLFMVFGEPDIEIKKQNGKIVVQVNGLDVYDPTTGQIRNSSTEDIACWFIDTNYNEESFFVRHAYFTGAEEPYEKLKRALRAEIDESAWSALYTTISRPFDPPKTGKIAVKVINHYGDEVLKVFEIK